jgi:site-specific DNA recombinase
MYFCIAVLLAAPLNNFCGLVHISEIFFPQKGVRFIAVHNGIDSENQQEADFTPFLNIMNETFS